MESPLKSCYEARSYIVNTIAALEMIVNAELVTSDQERLLLKMALKNASAALDTVDKVFDNLCAAEKAALSPL
jgi:hypothetical protein